MIDLNVGKNDACEVKEVMFCSGLVQNKSGNIQVIWESFYGFSSNCH